ncbi:hypothetical protein VFPPC_12224 [Pochonia chlamydosporia 170]|uniref:Uncharacterized protein n=1 Tax=Pochonia chlamydosporia 170 TaxID=1380566 RepID=A0A179EYL1_METCM|nr:hypothetical protein VFPPC_12224 [Pochonia chlamydosporia 170]OAQ58258.1 hypothetical protein VFPPC_12224 [Pochonia chlamydosporia 170]
MPSTRKVISDEERRGRALERKQAQRERARQQTIQSALSHPDQVQVVDAPSSSAPGSTITTAIPIPTPNLGHELERVVEGPGEVEEEARTVGFTLAIRARPNPPPTAVIADSAAAESQRASQSTREAASGLAASRMRRYRERQRNIRAEEYLAEAEQSDGIRVLSLTDAVEDVKIGPVEPSEEAVSRDVGDETLTLTRSVIYVSSSSSSSCPPTPSSANRAANLRPAAPAEGNEDTDTGDGASVSSFLIGNSSDSEDGHERRRPSDTSETLRPQPSTPGYGSSDGARPGNVDPSALQDDSVEDNGAGPAAAHHSTIDTRTAMNRLFSRTDYNKTKQLNSGTLM